MKNKIKQKVSLTFYIDADIYKVVKKYSSYTDSTIPKFIEGLIGSWYRQNIKVDKDFIYNMKDNIYKYVDFIDEELAQRTNDEKYKQI